MGRGACWLMGLLLAAMASACVGQVVTVTSDGRGLYAFSESLGASLVGDDLMPSPLVPGTFGAFAGRVDSAVDANNVTGTANATMNSRIGLLEMSGEASVYSRVTASGGTGYGSGTALFYVEFTVHEPTAFVLEGRLAASMVSDNGRGDVRVGLDLYGIGGPGGVASEVLLAEDGDLSPEPVDFSHAGVLVPGDYALNISAEARQDELEQETTEGLGSFRFVLNLGDRDGDGLADSWEENGIDLDGDGMPEIDLPAMGADPDRKDLFVEVDSMVGREPALGFSAALTIAFAFAPVENPDGTQGISLHLLMDEADIPLAGWPDPWPAFDAVKAARYGTAAERARPDWAAYRAARGLVYRYCVFADTIYNSTISGLSELPGDDFIVSLGGWHTAGGTPEQQRGTFMHELGHALGLRHGGGDDIHNKPNYYSVMNYLWQNPGGYDGWRLSYSEALAPTLNESMLDETRGAGVFKYGAVRSPIGLNGPPADQYMRRVGFVPMDGTVADWDGDGEIGGAVTGHDPTYIYLCQSMPPEPGCYQLPTPGQVLRGYDDWVNLHYGLGNAPDFADGVRLTPTLDEMTAEIAAVLEQVVDPGAPCNGADLAAPFGLLDLADVVAFVDAFMAQDPAADLAEPMGLLDLADVLAFVTAFGDGCP